MAKRYFALLGAAANAGFLILAYIFQSMGVYWTIVAVLLATVVGAVLASISVRWYEQSIIDDGTGLHNRRYLFRKLEKEFRHARRAMHPLALAVIDIDDFRNFNTRFGHTVGDYVLKEVATSLRNVIRKGDTVGRWGGEEFAVIFPTLDNAGAKDVAERMRLHIEQLRLVLKDVGEVSVSVSIGVVVDDGKCGAMLELVHQADHAMYLAKQQKNCVYFTSSVQLSSTGAS